MNDIAPDIRVLLVCPECKGELEDAPGALQCPSCKLSFPVVAGVPHLVRECASRLDRPAKR